MTHTIVGMFDSRSEAQAAMQELIQQGFVRENIDISNRSVVEESDSSTSSNSESGGISGFFNSLFGDDDTTASNYTNVASNSDAILAVQADSAERAEQAREILDRNGAVDVEERGAQYSRQNLAQDSGTTEAGASLQENVAIPVIEEDLQVGKREVERGGARIRSRIIEKPVEASVRLREEHVVVNRHPVNRAVTDTDLANFREGEIELTEHAEVPVVGKQARVVEEVEVGKNVTEHEETIRDTVRRTDVEVDEVETGTTQSTDVNTRNASS